MQEAFVIDTLQRLQALVVAQKDALARATLESECWKVEKNALQALVSAQKEALTRATLETEWWQAHKSALQAETDRHKEEGKQEVARLKNEKKAIQASHRRREQAWAETERAIQASHLHKEQAWAEKEKQWVATDKANAEMEKMLRQKATKYTAAFSILLSQNHYLREEAATRNSHLSQLYAVLGKENDNAKIFAERAIFFSGTTDLEKQPLKTWIPPFEIPKEDALALLPTATRETSFTTPDHHILKLTMDVSLTDLSVDKPSTHALLSAAGTLLPHRSILHFSLPVPHFPLPVAAVPTTPRIAPSSALPLKPPPVAAPQIL